MPVTIDPASIFIVIPAYNENQVIASVVDELVTFGYSIIVVDDGSVRPLKPLLQNKPIYFLRHKVNLGQGAALQTGIDFAIKKQAQFIITFDADGQHDPTDIQKLLTVANDAKAGIVLGSRFIGKEATGLSLQRRYILQLARMVNFISTGILLTDAHNGLRLLSHKAACKIHLTENGMAHATEILWQIKKAGLRYTECPVHIRYTKYSKSKGQTVWSGFRIIIDLFLNKLFR